MIVRRLIIRKIAMEADNLYPIFREATEESRSIWRCYMNIEPEIRANMERAVIDASGLKKKLEVLKKEKYDTADQVYIRISTGPTVYLVAVIGGVVGSWIGVWLLGHLSALAGPSGMMLGAAIAVLKWRGPAMWWHEQTGVNFDAAMKRVNAALASLPEDALPADKDELYEIRRKLVRSYGDMANKAVQFDAQNYIITENKQIF